MSSTHDENEGPLSPLCWWISILVATWVITQVDKLQRKIAHVANKAKKREKKENTFNLKINLIKVYH
jgi:hypothetical protein